MTASRRPSGLRVLAATALLTAAVACALNPPTGRRSFSLMSETREIAAGRASDAQIRTELGVYDDPALQEYVSGIGSQLAKVSERPTLPWQFTVLDQPAVNAFAMPGGFIYVTRGILPFLKDESQLAGVLAHVIGHVAARHAARQYSSSPSSPLLPGLSAFSPAAQAVGRLSAESLSLLFPEYSRDDELQVDRRGVEYAARAGWDPDGVPGMLSTLGRLDEAQGDQGGVPNWLTTHPLPLARVGEIRPAIDQLRAGRQGLITGQETLLRHLDGLVFGDNPAQGMVRANTFLHPQLRVRLDFPAGWNVTTGPQQARAKAPADEVYMLLQIVPASQGTIEEVARRSMESAGFRATQGARTVINGLEAFVGAYEGNIAGVGAVTSRAAHIGHDGRVFLVAGLAAAADFGGADAAFMASVQSFRPLSAGEAEDLRPGRISLHVVRDGDSWSALAERSGGQVRGATLARMNNVSPDSQPRAGATIKIVVGR